MKYAQVGRIANLIKEFMMHHTTTLLIIAIPSNSMSNKDLSVPFMRNS